MKSAQMILTGIILALDYVLLQMTGGAGGRTIINTLLEVSIFLFSFMFVFKLTFGNAEVTSST